MLAQPVDQGLIDGAVNGVAAAVAAVGRQAPQDPDRVRPQLRPHPPVRGHRGPVPLPDPGGGLMAFPYGTALLAIPAAGAVVTAAHPGPAGRPRRGPWPSASRWSPSSSRSPSSPTSTRPRPATSSSSRRSWIEALGIRYLMGVDGISLFMVVLTGLLFPIALLASTQVDQEGQRLLRPHADPRGRPDGHLPVGRPLPVLRLLGGDARPDVLPHRDVGLRPAHLRRPQVLHLHRRRVGPPAAGDPVAGRPPRQQPPAPT